MVIPSICVEAILLTCTELSPIALLWDKKVIFSCSNCTQPPANKPKCYSSQKNGNCGHIGLDSQHCQHLCAKPLRCPMVESAGGGQSNQLGSFGELVLVTTSGLHDLSCRWLPERSLCRCRFLKIGNRLLL